ncbi:MAG: hypothetical protein PVS3B3_08680 [Ktedonobacteraceae bacterium]
MRQTIQEYRIPITVISIILVVALLSTSLWLLLGHRSENKQSVIPEGTTKTTIKTVTPQTTPEVVPVSPLLFGTNLGLFDNKDQVINSTATQALLQQIHTQIIRMPVRHSLSNATEIQAAQDIKNIGAIPLLVLHGANTPTALADDSVIIKDMNTIFGKSIVYYEFGNEEDFAFGIDATTYTNSWNRTVPQLKKLALNGHFIGPVNYQYTRSYLTTFLQNAQPRPDEISWHEYTCSKNEQPDVCLAKIDRWTTHITDARDAMQTTIGTTLPIMITEWNYAPDLQVENTGLVPADGKHENAAFMTAWTTKALQTLAANRVFASMQYSCTNTPIPLVDSNNTITPQGTIFKNTYQQMIIQRQQPGVASATMVSQQNSTPATTPGNNTSSFSFEDGTTNGWDGHGQGISNVQNSTMFAQDGNYSLQATLSNASSSNFPYVAVSTADNPSYPRAGQTITAYVYIADTTTTVNAKLFITEHNYKWHTGTSVSLTPNTWNRLTLLVPAMVTEQPRQIGVQFNSVVGSSSNVYIDAVKWA